LKLVFLFRVVVVLDISVTNSMYIIHIQHSLRLLLEEQLSNKDCFNLIACVPVAPVGRDLGVPPTLLGSGPLPIVGSGTTDMDVTRTPHPKRAIGLSDLDDLVWGLE
jgi:hypothetical protein